MNIILFSEGESFFPSSDSRCQHIRKVLKLKVGDSFSAGIIDGLAGKAVIEKDDEEGISFSFHPEKDLSSLFPLDMIIAQVRPICMKRILRECASLGVGRLLLPVSDLGEKSYLDSSLYRSGEYESILIDGAMQAARTGVTKACLYRCAEDAASSADSDSIKLLLDNAIGAASLSDLDLSSSRVTIAIGPERGWSDAERAMFIEKGFRPVLIGDRILRTETAAVAGAAIALVQMGLI